MRILYVSHYFPPEMGAPAARVHELSREWVRLGHDVTVLTGFAHHPTGVKAPSDRGRLTRRERVDGIDVLRAYVYATANAGIAKRMLSYASFMVSAAVIGSFRVAKPDIVVATSPQLLCACAGRALAWRFRVPFVFEVRDLWPESIIAVEAMRDNVLVRALKRVARGLYRSSTRIVTVGAGYKRQIELLYGIDPRKMDVVPNGIDPALFAPAPRDNEVRRELGWGERTVVMYVGTHGMAHALHVVLEAARTLRDDPRLLFVFVGEGARKAELERLAAEWGLDNVQFVGQQPKARVPAFYAACDLGLVTLRKTPLFQEVLPSKIFEYLAMERPLVISVDGEARELVERAGAGRFVEPENADALVEAVRDLAGDPRRLAEMGRAGRAFVLAHFRRSVLAERYAELLAGLVGEGARALKLVFLNQYYPPAEAATAPLLADVAEDLARAGHEVLVITGSRSYPEPGKLRRGAETVRGVRVHRTWTTGFGRSTRWGRVADYTTYFAGAVFRLARERRPDVIVSLTSPPFVSLVGVALARLKRARSVFWVMDVYPELAFELGALARDGLVGRLLSRLARTTLARSDRVVALGGRMAERLVELGAPSADVIPNWEDGTAIVPREIEGHPLRGSSPSPGSFVVLYSGNLGLAHDFESVLDAAGRLREESAIAFVFVGVGPRLAEVRDGVARRGLTNVELRPFAPRERLGESLTAGDLHLVTLREGLDGLLLPSKIYGILAAGRPCLFVGPARAEIATLLTAGRCGMHVAAGDGAGLARAIRAYAADPARCRAEGARAREVFLRDYDRPRALARWRALLEASAVRL